ncbi:hypothetical protein ETX26_01760 [Pelagerythrobacter rhizovicinus]|uniref:Uncharacterized protein n=1 Tax=Pelagerythrobacter rhizovicinus TaxID=2268576 RepID=A0A4Q2KM58_9SPHN|nr:hypothetical protein ETX26_01760 [Pelagerythrobacter rhizovicinus]
MRTRRSAPALPRLPGDRALRRWPRRRARARRACRRLPRGRRRRSRGRPRRGSCGRCRARGAPCAARTSAGAAVKRYARLPQSNFGQTANHVVASRLHRNQA